MAVGFRTIPLGNPNGRNRLAVGERNRKITIERATRTPDGAGGFSSGWTQIGAAWVKARPVGGTERLIAGTLRSNQGWTITMPYRDDLTDKDRIILDGKAINIASAVDPDGRREVLVVMGETGTPS